MTPPNASWIVVHVTARPTIAAFMAHVETLGLDVIRVVAYRDGDGVRGSVMGRPR